MSENSDLRLIDKLATLDSPTSIFVSELTEPHMRQSSTMQT